jgi:basic membrane lipoprotein Med (substrate-binding protein (PBP1-ABC) superfamily)
MAEPRPRPCVALLALLAWASACGGEAGPGPTFRVALLTPGSIADGGWNAGAFEGLQAIRDQLGAEVRHVETRTPAEFEEGFRDFASRGYALVFGHGFEYQEAAAKVGAEFPSTIFITTSGNTLRPNVAPMVFELEQATYLCGVLAARMTGTGLVGLIGGVDLPSIRSTFTAFRGGVLAARPEVRVREVFTGNFDDVAAAREAALALLEEGADLLLHQANDAGRGVFRAVADRARAGQRVFAFGTNRNQNDMAPEVVLASATLDIPRALLAVARRVREGGFRPEPQRLGMREGIVALEMNPQLRPRVPAEVLEETARLEARIRSGELVVPRGEF